MREDMFKVIVERPRLVNSNGYSRDGRKFRNDENAPARLGMKRGYVQWRKFFNENLAPLKRYLEQQVNRPWDKVYGEIRATIDARSTVKQHILQHIDDFVAIDTHWVDTPAGGQVIVRGRWPRGDVPIEEAMVELFVHPRTGILLRNRRFMSWDQRNRQARETAQARDAADCREIDAHRQLRRIDGIWYEVTFATLPPPRKRLCNTAIGVTMEVVHDACWDVIQKAWVSRKEDARRNNGIRMRNREMIGDADKYAASKRQLGAQELKKHGLK